jgi:hypothetical protein
MNAFLIADARLTANPPDPETPGNLSQNRNRTLSRGSDHEPGGSRP